MKVFSFLALLTVCGGLVFGQEPASETKPSQPAEKTTSKESSRSEQEIATIKLAECRNEIELAKLAQQKSQNEQVKQFAETLIRDHREACKDLEKWAGDYKPVARVQTETSTTIEEKDEKGKDEKEKSGARLELQTKKGAVVGVDFNAGAKHAVAGEFNWVTVHQEMASKCLEAAKKELGEKEGAEFDKCFIGMQLGAHQKTIIADEVLEKYVSAGAREKLEKCKATATEHLQTAKTIMKSLESKPAAEVSKR